MDFFAFCESWQTSVVCFCQRCDTSMKFSICSNAFCCKEFFVGSKSFCPLTIADGIQVTQFTQFFNCKGEVVQNSWFKIFVSRCKWHMKKGARSRQDNLFSWNLIQDFQALFIVVAPDVFPIHNTSIKGLISWEATFHQFKRFLPFNKVKTNTIYWQVHKVIVDITNITKVSLDQDFKAFLVSQEFVVEVQEESFFFS